MPLSTNFKTMQDIAGMFAEAERRKTLAEFNQTAGNIARNYVANVRPDQLTQDNFEATVNDLRGKMNAAYQGSNFLGTEIDAMSQNIANSYLSQRQADFLGNPARVVGGLLHSTVVENQNSYNDGKISYADALKNIASSIADGSKYLTDDEINSAKKQSFSNMFSYANSSALDGAERAALISQTAQYLPVSDFLSNDTVQVRDYSNQELGDAFNKIYAGDKPNQSLLKHPTLMHAYQIVKDNQFYTPLGLQGRVADTRLALTRELGLSDNASDDDIENFLIKNRGFPSPKAEGLAFQYSVLQQRLSTLENQYVVSSADAAIKQGNIAREVYSMRVPEDRFRMFVTMEKHYSNLWYREGYGSTFLPKEYYDAYTSYLNSLTPKEAAVDLSSVAPLLSNHSRAAFLKQLVASDRKYGVAFFLTSLYPETSADQLRDILNTDYSKHTANSAEKLKEVQLALSNISGLPDAIRVPYNNIGSFSNKLAGNLASNGALLVDRDMVSNIRNTAEKNMHLFKMLDYRKRTDAKYYWNNDKARPLTVEDAKNITLINSENLGYYVYLGKTGFILTDDEGKPFEFFADQYRTLPKEKIGWWKRLTS